jgi:hypothetical protein
MKFVLDGAARGRIWKRLLFFFICIAIGVAAIVALRLVIQNGATCSRRKHAA